MVAVILAAGYATRLYPLTLEIPKCLLPVAGRPILDTLCEKLLPLKGLEEILVVSNAKFTPKIEAWCSGFSSPVPVKILNDGTFSNETRLGAIGDLALALQAVPGGKDLLVLASDNLFEEGLSEFLSFALAKEGAFCVGIHDIGDPQLGSGKYGILELAADGRVIGMEEKPEHPRTSLIGMGVYYLPGKLVGKVGEYLADPVAKDAPGYFVRWLMGKAPIFGLRFPGMWYDIGDLRALQEADNVFKTKK